VFATHSRLRARYATVAGLLIALGCVLFLVTLGTAVYGDARIHRPPVGNTVRTDGGPSRNIAMGALGMTAFAGLETMRRVRRPPYKRGRRWRSLLRRPESHTRPDGERASAVAPEHRHYTRRTRSRVRQFRMPSGRWMLLVVCLVTLFLSLVLEAQLTHPSVPDSSRVRSAGLARNTGPILNASPDGIGFTRVPRRTVLLTFNGGPDPVWTPAILQLLQRAHVPATFFMVGSRAAQHPAIVRAVIDSGHEVGLQTFRPADVGAHSARVARADRSLSQAALEAAAGVHTNLLRPPYVATASQLTSVQLERLQEATRAGFVVVLADRDAGDWQRPGVDTIVERSMPRRGAGAIIQLHDGGGERGQSVQATSALIDRLRRAGYRFTTVSDVTGASPGDVVSHVSWTERLRSRTLVTLLPIAAWVTRVLGILVVLVAALTLARALLLLAGAVAHNLRRQPVDQPIAPSVCVIVPAYNEEVGIARTVRALLGSVYEQLEVVVVDDGSSDGTADVVASIIDPRLMLLRGKGGGKWQALNRALRATTHDIVVTVDADTIVQPGTIAALVQPFRDSRVGAVAGNVKVWEPRGVLGRCQHLEYIMGANLDRRCLDLLRCMPTVPGAIGAFRRTAMERVGGFSPATLAEDTDLTLAIGRVGWQIRFASKAVAYTEVPGSLHDLWRQRCRWAYGTAQNVWKHRHAARHAGGKRSRMGGVGLPYLALFQVLLPLVGPAIDLFALAGLVLHRRTPVVFWIAFLAVQYVLALTALILEREPLRNLWILPVQQLGHRQLTYLACYDAIVRALRGGKSKWNKVARRGELLRVPPTLVASRLLLRVPPPGER
jgi:cellulose synthase/poly-beta-1,6-N-acetylglucosamine synthase-like glycosyltransferase/peptidoglycan/xylan/chitin deacetylase (PgdA/CDA1 family)